MLETIIIPEIKLNWSNLYKFKEIQKNVRDGGINLPNTSGVYKVLDENNEIIHIGRASNLRSRVKQGFVKGNNKHSTRKRIIENGIDLTKLKIQWAVTEWPNSVEEYLHKEFKRKYGKLPKYTKVT